MNDHVVGNEIMQAWDRNIEHFFLACRLNTVHDVPHRTIGEWTRIQVTRR
jgi:hypothetical protein